MADKDIRIDIKTNADLKGAKEAAEGLKDVAKEVDNVKDSAEEFNNTTKDFGRGIEDAVASTNTKLGRQARQFRRLRGSFNGLTKASGKAATAIRVLAKGLGLTAAAGAAFKGLQLVQTGMEKLDEPVRQLNDDLKITESGFGKVVAPLAATTGGLRSFITTLNNWTNPFEKWKQFRTAIGEQAESIRNVNAAYADYLTVGQKAREESAKRELAAAGEAFALLQIKENLEKINRVRETGEEFIESEENAYEARNQNLERAKDLEIDILKLKFEQAKAVLELETDTGVRTEKQKILEQQFLESLNRINQEFSKGLNENQAVYESRLKAEKENLTFRQMELQILKEQIPTEKRLVGLAQIKAQTKKALEDERSLARQLVIAEKIKSTNDLDRKEALRVYSDLIKEGKSASEELRKLLGVDEIISVIRAAEQSPNVIAARKDFGAARDLEISETKIKESGVSGFENLDQLDDELGKLASSLAGLDVRLTNLATSRQIRERQEADKRVIDGENRKLEVIRQNVQAQQEAAIAAENLKNSLESINVSQPAELIKKGVSKRDAEFLETAVTSGLGNISEALKDGLTSNEAKRVVSITRTLLGQIDQSNTELAELLQAILDLARQQQDQADGLQSQISSISPSVSVGGGLKPAAGPARGSVPSGGIGFGKPSIQEVQNAARNQSALEANARAGNVQSQITLKQQQQQNKNQRATNNALRAQ